VVEAWVEALKLFWVDWTVGRVWRCEACRSMNAKRVLMALWHGVCFSDELWNGEKGGRMGFRCHD
jgi:hypothetical protein